MTHALAIPPLADFDSYVNAVFQIPMLSPDEEQALIIKKDEDVNAAYRLTTAYLRLVVSIAKKYSGYGLPLEDLVQEGNIGLMKAVKRFDPSKAVKLVSYAYAWIQAEIQEYIIRNWRLVKIATTKAQRKLFFNLRRMRSTEKRIPEHEAQRIAAELNVPIDELRTMEIRFAGNEVQIDPSEDDDGDDRPHFSPLSFLADNNVVSSVDTADHKEQLELMHQAIEQLPPRDRDILNRRWLVEDDKKSTLAELAADHGVSLERIRQLEVKAIKLLRSQLC